MWPTCTPTSRWLWEATRCFQKEGAEYDLLRVDCLMEEEEGWQGDSGEDGRVVQAEGANNNNIQVGTPGGTARGIRTNSMGLGVQWDPVTENHVVPVHCEMCKYTIIPSSPGPIEHRVPLNPRVPLH